VKNIGIICEYNPFHNGHAKQLRTVHAQDGTCVCLMSGNYVQRGEPAILDKWTRAKAAVLCGADLVLELPVTYALRSAEGFAAGGVEIFDRLGCIDGLSFGSELVDINNIMSTAEALDSTEFSEHLHDALAEGLSFPAARQQALAALGADTAALEKPNSILAVEYCKALRRRNSTIVPMLLHRDGDYHGGSDPAAPAASFLRVQSDWTGFVPPEALEVFSGAVRHTAAAGERAWLARLRGMEEVEFSCLPFGSEGLWRKVMAACRTEPTIAAIVQAAKSKRYTHTRLMRMLLCAYLGISEEMLMAPAPYVRVLAVNPCGQSVLRQAKKSGDLLLLHIGERAPAGEYAALERRAADLYSLFTTTENFAVNQERSARLFRAP